MVPASGISKRVERLLFVCCSNTSSETTSCLAIDPRGKSKEERRKSRRSCSASTQIATSRGRSRAAAEATTSSRSCSRTPPSEDDREPLPKQQRRQGGAARDYNSRRTSEDRNQSDNVVRDLSENVEDPEEEHRLMEDITR